MPERSWLSAGLEGEQNIEILPIVLSIFYWDSARPFKNVSYEVSLLVMDLLTLVRSIVSIVSLTRQNCLIEVVFNNWLLNVEYATDRLKA